MIVFNFVEPHTYLSTVTDGDTIQIKHMCDPALFCSHHGCISRSQRDTKPVSMSELDGQTISYNTVAVLKWIEHVYRCKNIQDVGILSYQRTLLILSVVPH